MLSKDEPYPIANAAIFPDSDMIIGMVGNETLPLYSIGVFSHLYLWMRETSQRAAIGAPLIQDAV